MPFIDFQNNSMCGSAQQYVFIHDYTLMGCKSELLSEFEVWDDEIYDTLHACCLNRFPNSITSCCEAPGAGGCALSGTVQWLPDWANGHCYEKDTNLIEEWEWRWAHETLESCCSRCKWLLYCQCACILVSLIENLTNILT